MTNTFGPDYDESLDGERLDVQKQVIKDLMLDSRKFLTLAEIHNLTGFPESSISAQLRHLRKPRFGGYTVEKRRRKEGAGTWEYAVFSPEPEDESGQLNLFG